MTAEQLAEATTTKIQHLAADDIGRIFNRRGELQAIIQSAITTSLAAAFDPAEVELSMHEGWAETYRICREKDKALGFLLHELRTSTHATRDKAWKERLLAMVEDDISEMIPPSPPPAPAEPAAVATVEGNGTDVPAPGWYFVRGYGFPIQWDGKYLHLEQLVEHVGSYNGFDGQLVPQSAINSATSELQAENERLKEELKAKGSQCP